MSALTQHLEDYLTLRRSLGHELADSRRLLPRFLAYLEAAGLQTITVDAALTWVQLPEADAASSVWMRRMTAVRGFARYMSGLDPATEVPPLGLVTFRPRWRRPFIYSADDVAALIAGVPMVASTPLRVATFQTMLGFLAATGMRVGEVISLERGHIDWVEGVVEVRDAKFRKSREIPLHPTTTEALAAYAETRDHHVPRPTSPTFFITSKGTRVLYPEFGRTFRELLTATGVGAASPVRPRIHDFRHSFAVNTLTRWYRQGADVGALLPRLSTYLGHLAPSYTYWYLSAAPELLGLAATRLDKDKEASR
jgi:integrase/recombinase XerD